MLEIHFYSSFLKSASTKNSIQVTWNSGYVGLILNSYDSKLKNPSYVQYVRNSPGKGIESAFN